MGNFNLRIKPSEFQKIQRKFDRLVDRTQNKVIKTAVRETMKPVLAEARSRAPQGETGSLRKAIKLKVAGYRRNGIVVGIVGVNRGKKLINGQEVAPSKYAHLVEFGTVAHGPKKAKVMTNGKTFFGRRVRGVQARPFLRPTFDGNKNGMERDVRVRVGRGIEKLAAGL